VRVKRILVGALPSNLPCDRIVITMELSRPIESFKELEELGIDFYDRAVELRAEELRKLLEKLGVNA